MLNYLRVNDVVLLSFFRCKVSPESIIISFSLFTVFMHHSLFLCRTSALRSYVLSVSDTWTSVVFVLASRDGPVNNMYTTL